MSKVLVLIIGMAFLSISCSEVNVRYVHTTPQCNFAQMNLADYKRLQTKGGALYVHKTVNYVCEASK